jgi:hypothetical protein
MCADDELYSNLFLFIHITGKVFHISHFPLILERICQVASTVAIIGILFFGQLATNANIVSYQLAPSLQQELHKQGLSSVVIDQVTSAFHTCFQDRASENDSTVQPESCQHLTGKRQLSQQAQTVLLQATAWATAQNYAHAFVVSVWYNIGLLLIKLVLTYWLPHQAPTPRLASIPEQMER